MSDTEVIDLTEESKLTESIIELPKKEHKDILVKLKIPALAEIETAKSIKDESNESKNKFKQELEEVMNHSIEVLDKIKQGDFSKDPDFLELQILETEQNLEQISKALWVKLELTNYEDPKDYYSMIKTAKAVFSSDLKDLMEKEKEIKSQNLNEELKELYENKFNIEDKLLAL